MWPKRLHDFVQRVGLGQSIAFGRAAEFPTRLRSPSKAPTPLVVIPNTAQGAAGGHLLRDMGKVLAVRAGYQGTAQPRGFEGIVPALRRQ